MKMYRFSSVLAYPWERVAKKTNEALALKAAINKKVQSLKAKVKSLEAEAHLTEGLHAIVSQWEKKLEAKRIVAVEDFHSLEEFTMIKLEFTTNSYLQGLVDCRAKV